MARYALRRTLLVIPFLVVISIVLFLILHLAPGGPAAIYAADPSATPDVVERLNHLWGLDRPLPVQYGTWLENVVQGDWGMSFSQRRPVLDVVLERLPATLLLTGSALLIALFVGFPLGVLAATSRRRWSRPTIQGFSVLGMSVPTFWSGAMVILVLSVHWRLLPAGGMTSLGGGGTGDLLRHLVGPAIVLGSVSVAVWMRYVDAAVSEMLAEDFMRTARAKGVGSRRAIWMHALPNAAAPLLTVLGLQMGQLLSGAIVTEVVFSWPGLGNLLTQSLTSRDYPVAMGVMMLLAAGVVVANLLTDLAYGLVDPRVRYS